MSAVNKPGAVTSLGNELLEAAKALDTSTIKRELAAFATVHRRWVVAQEKVDVARGRELGARLTRGELDAEQDAAVDELARLLVGDGFNRTAPFKTFKTLAPAKLKALGDDAEAAQALALAAAVQKDKRTSPGTRKAAQALSRAATAVQGATKRITPAAASTSAQRTQRDALLQQWMKAHAVLKLAARLAEASGGPALATTLFPKVSRPAPARAKVATPVAPA